MALLPLEPFNRVRRMNTAAVERYMAKHGHRTVLIYSAQWSSFWKTGGAGYTKDPNQAGLYSLADAFARTCHCGPEKEIHYELLD